MAGLIPQMRAFDNFKEIKAVRRLHAQTVASKELKECRPETNTVYTGIFEKPNGLPCPIDINTFIGWSGAIWGMSGSGKTYLAHSLLEDIMHKNMLFTVIDFESEYDLAGVQRVRAEKILAEGISRFIFRNMVELKRVIIDCGNLGSETEFAVFVYKYVKIAFKCSIAYQKKFDMRCPHLIFIDEAQLIVPAIAPKNEPFYQKCLGVMANLVRRGRKRGINLVLCAQAIADVHFSIIKNCKFHFLLRSEYLHDRERYAKLLGMRLNDPLIQELINFNTGKAILRINGIRGYQILRVRQRAQAHKSSTTTIDDVRNTTVKEITEDDLPEFDGEFEEDLHGN